VHLGRRNREGNFRGCRSRFPVDIERRRDAGTRARGCCSGAPRRVENLEKYREIKRNGRLAFPISGKDRDPLEGLQEGRRRRRMEMEKEGRLGRTNVFNLYKYEPRRPVAFCSPHRMPIFRSRYVRRLSSRGRPYIDFVIERGERSSAILYNCAPPFSEASREDPRICRVSRQASRAAIWRTEIEA